jgi:hypothetical protein
MPVLACGKNTDTFTECGVATARVAIFLPVLSCGLEMPFQQAVTFESGPPISPQCLWKKPWRSKS